MSNMKRTKKFYHKKSDFNQGVQTVGNVARTATAAMGAAKLALSLINPEFKARDVDITNPTVTTSHVFDLLNGISRSTTYNTRIGNSIKMVSLDVGVLVTRNTASTTNNFVRCAIILDKNPNATVMTATEMYAAAAANPILSPRNLDNRNRFVTLKEWIIDIGNAGNRPSVHMKSFKKLNMHTIYNGSTTGLIDDIQENALYFMCVSDASTNAPSVTFYSRIRYLDN